MKFDTLHGPITRRLTELSIEKYQFLKKDVNKEVDKYFYLMSKIDDPNDLINSLSFYVNGMDSTTINYGYAEKAIFIGSKLLESDTTDGYIRRQIAFYCSNLSFQSLDFKLYKSSLDAVIIAIKADSTYQLSYTNLPLAYLFNNRYSDAEKEYLKWKDKPWTVDNSAKTFKEIFLIDFADLESRGITHPDFEKVKELLKK